MMAIEMVGAVYCPLSPRDPSNRLHSLVQQTRSRLVLIHHSTKAKFHDHITSIDIDSILIQNDLDVDENRVDRLSDVTVTSTSIAYIIFTSGSTGAPKAVSDQFNETTFIICFSSRLKFDIRT